MSAARHGGGRLVGGRYLLEDLVGRGGMGEVWRARHIALKAEVAIKFLHGSGEPSARARRRFLTEAQVTASLRTRHAVKVFDFGVSDDGRPYLVMELLLGETLDKRIARAGRLPLATTSRYLLKAARALERAHALGIVHRDFKPENVMLVPDEEEGEDVVKVVDFGIAKLVGDLDATLKGALGQMAMARRAPSSSGEGSSEPGLDSSSSGVGTPNYMAPEQVQGSAQIGPAADIWAFGVVAYECLTGRRPFDEDSLPKLLARVLTATPPAPASSFAPVPARFDDWFRVACAPSPSDRFPDMQAAAAALAFALDAAPACVATPATPLPKPAALPTLASQRSPADAVGSVLVPAPEIPATSATRPGTCRVSPLAATLDPAPRPSPTPVSPVSLPAAPRSVPRRARVLAIAAAALGLLAVTHDRARPPGGSVVLAAAQLPPAPRPAPIPDLPSALPPPPVATVAPSGSAEQASTAPAEKRSPLAPPPGRRRAHVAPSEATPSAYRLPPLGL